MARTYHRLTSDHAEDLAALEQVYPQAMRQGKELIRERLQVLESTPFQLSWTCREDGRCTGYLFAYPAPSQLDGPETEFVIYIDDLQVVEGAETALFRLLNLFVRDIRKLGLRDLPIEGVCRSNSYRLFTRHEPLMKRLGWELARQREYWEETIGETLIWLQWTPLVEDLQANPARSPELRLKGELANLNSMLNSANHGGNLKVGNHAPDLPGYQQFHGHS